MATPLKRRLINDRDIELLTALDWAPMTARQLARLSSVWPKPFQALRTIRDRLQQLTEIGLIKTFRYATVAPGQPENYYLLTRSGYQIVHGPDVRPPTKGYGAEVAISRQMHTRAVADFLVHTAVAAHHAGVDFTGVYRENSVRLAAGDESVYPDASFILIAPDRTTYRFFLEIDCGTERVRSDTSDQSWERKARVYDRVQDTISSNRFRVLIVAARSGADRLHRMLAAASAVQRNLDRTLFYGIPLYAYLASGLGVTAPIFVNHRGARQSLVAERPFAAAATAERLLVPTHA
jgi:hypothetical protein